MSEEIILYCIECGARLQEDLITYLREGKMVYCEQCGFENKPSDFNLKIIPKVNASKTPKDLKTLIKATGNRLLKKVKTKINEMREEQKNR